MGRERIHLAIGTIATGILVATLGLYIWREPLRMETASLDLLNHQIIEGQVAYAQNCALCHGAAGEGLGANPSLDNPGIREGDYEALYKVVARGPGQFHSMTGAIEQFHTEGLLKRLDMMAYCRLRDMQSLCCFRET